VFIEILGRSEIDPRTMVADVWISGSRPGVWAAELRRFPDVQAVEALAEVGSGSLYRIRFVSPPIVGFYRTLQIPLPFPVRIHAGHVLWEAVARAPEFARILEFTRGIDPSTKIAWTRRPPLKDHLPTFTPSQRALLHRAIAEGYFAVPRGISLSELARLSNRSKSAVSQAMALIEQRLLESTLRQHSFVVGPHPE